MGSSESKRKQGFFRENSWIGEVGCSEFRRYVLLLVCLGKAFGFVGGEGERKCVWVLTKREKVKVYLFA